MSNHKHLSVRSLRELAREHLGRGHSSLKTRDELVAALKRAVPEVMAKVLGKPEAREVQAAEVAPPRIERRKGPRIQGRLEAAQSTPPKAQVPEPESARTVGSVSPEPVEGPGPEASPATAPLTEGFFRSPARRAEPLIEGFFVARMAGERELLRHHLVEAEVPFHDAISTLNARGEESLGELPAAYDDDQVVLLARDPRTLYFFWNFGPALARVRADAARLWVRLFEGQALVREQAVELGTGGVYLHELTPGRAYRVECYVRGGDGQVSRLRAVSNVAQLPAEAPSEDLNVRVMRVPWGSPLQAGEAQEMAPSGEWIDTPAAPLPSSQDVPEAPPDWAHGPHLDLPSSHDWRGGPHRR